MQHAYSWYGSRIHLVLEDDLAAAYNRRSDQFRQAQIDHKVRTGSEWNGRDPLRMVNDDEAHDAWNKIASIINLLAEVNGGGIDVPEEECTSDYLVKL